MLGSDSTRISYARTPPDDTAVCSRFAMLPSNVVQRRCGPRGLHARTARASRTSSSTSRVRLHARCRTSSCERLASVLHRHATPCLQIEASQDLEDEAVPRMTCRAVCALSDTPDLRDE